MAKAKTKPARKSKAKQMKTAAVRERHPGRRPEPNPKVKERHAKKLTARVEKLNAAEAKVQQEKNELAAEIDAATADDCSTQWICDTVGKSRQTIFKLVKERVDLKDLKPNWGQQNGGGKAKAKSTESKAKQKAEKKPAKAKASKPTKTKATAKPKATKAKPKGVSKPPAKPNGRKADPAGMTKGKGKAAKRPARRPRPRLRPRPKATA